MISAALTVIGVFLCVYTYELFRAHIENCKTIPAMISLFGFAAATTGLIMSATMLIKTVWFV